jgi:hypothetical protein
MPPTGLEGCIFTGLDHEKQGQHIKCGLPPNNPSAMGGPMHNDPSCSIH